MNHIGIAVRSLEEAIQTYERLGFTVAHREQISDMKVNVAFLNIGESQIELLEPLTSDSVIAKFLEKRGEGVHHICFEVENILLAMAHYKKQGFQCVYDEPKSGAHHTKVNFIHPKSTHGTFIEICEKAR